MERTLLLLREWDKKLQLTKQLNQVIQDKPNPDYITQSSNY